MNSLAELNSNSLGIIDFTDNRPVNVLFDRATPTPQTKITFEGTSYSSLVGIEITEVINYQSAACTYTVDVSGFANTTVTWPTVPSGCTVTNPSTGIYRISGINSKAIWQQVRYPTINLPQDGTYGSFTVTSYIQYNSATENNIKMQWTTATTINQADILASVVDYSYTTPGTSYSLGSENRVPLIVQNTGATYTYTITPSKTEGISTMSASPAGAGGTASFNNTTKVLTLTGTRTQINFRLASFVVSLTSGYYWDYSLTYLCVNSGTGGSNIRIQNWVSTDAQYLIPKVSNEEYSLNTVADISNGPKINDSAYTGTNFYVMDVFPYVTAAVSNISVNTSFTFEKYQRIDDSTEVLNSSSLSYARDIDVSGDGLTMAHWNGDIAGNASASGSIAVYTRATVNSNWVQQTILAGSSVAANRNLGAISIALSNDGNTLAATSGSYASSVTDKTYIFTRAGTTWTEQTTINNSASTSAGSANSVSLSSDGNTLAIGLPSHPTSSVVGGGCKIMTRTAGTWSQQQIVTEDTPVASRGFGYVVSLSADGNTLACGKKESGTSMNGIVYIFTRTGSTWTKQQILTSGSTAADGFGERVSLSGDGDTVAIGTLADNRYTPGIWIYKRTAGVWAFEFSEKSPNYQIYGGYDQSQTFPYSLFGICVKLSYDGSKAFVGAPYASTTGSGATYSDGSGAPRGGAIYVYTRSGDVWSFQNNLTLRPDYSTEVDETRSGTAQTFGRAFGIASDGGAVVTVGLRVSGSFWYKAFFYYRSGSTSFNSGTKTLTITAKKLDINTYLDLLQLTPATSYTTNIDLIYKVVTPNSITAYRNQTVNNV